MEIVSLIEESLDSLCLGEMDVSKLKNKFPAILAWFEKYCGGGQYSSAGFLRGDETKVVVCIPYFPTIVSLFGIYSGIELVEGVQKIK